MESHKIKSSNRINKSIPINFEEESEKDIAISHNICRFCEAEFLLASELDDHFRDQHSSEKYQFQCEQCNKLFIDAIKYGSHMKSHETRKYICPFCNRKYISKESLENHKKREHAKINMKCSVCLKSFTKMNLFKYHMKTHSSDKRFKCKFCPKQFLQPHHLQNHERTHTGEKPFLCTVCGQTFNLKLTLDAHLANKHNQYPSGSFDCHDCNKKFHTKLRLTHHIQQYHTVDRPFKCSFCDRTFAVDLYRRTHEKKHIEHRNPYLYHCKFCDNTFLAKVTLQNHMLRAHETEMHYSDKQAISYDCKFCDKQFVLPSTLDTHMKTHTEERNFACNECNDRFRSEKNLQKHINLVHRKNKPHACTVRNKYYTLSKI